MNTYKSKWNDLYYQFREDGFSEDEASCRATAIVTEYYADMADRAKDEEKERRYFGGQFK